MRAGLYSLLALSLLAGTGACDGGEIVVFSAMQAGSAGTTASAGSGGSATVGGAGGGFGAAPAAAGSGGAATSGAGGGDAVGNPCKTSADCDSAWFCQKQTCSDAAGVCLPLPVSDDPQLAAVCGCDHRTYFNDTLRQQRRISASTPNQCGSDVRTCMFNGECGTDGSCSHQTAQISDCSMPGLGQCWVVPNDCESTSEKPRWLPCPPPGTQPGAPLPPCLTTCQAIQSGLGYLHAPKDACH